jgi:hypothetical protein
VLPPYNNRFNPTQRGRHAFCSGGSIRLVFRQKSRRTPPSSVLSRPAKWGPQLRGLIERYTDVNKECAVLILKDTDEIVDF